MEPNAMAPSEASDVQMREQVRGVNQLHDGVDRMRADLKRLAKIAKSYVATCEPLNDVGVEFAEQLQEFGAGKDELELYVRQCGEMLKLTEAMRQLLVQQLESGFAEPLRARLEAETAKETTVKELHKHWASAGEAYTDAHKKWNKAKDPRGSVRPASVKLSKIESDVSDARTVFEKATSDYNTRLKEMDNLSKMEMVESLTAFMQANISFFVSGYQLMKSIEPQVAAMTATIQRAKGDPPKSENQSSPSEIFAIKPAAAAAAHKSGNSNVTKQGYLFKKKSKGLKGWGIRWFVLDAEGRLSWFKSWKKFTQKSESLSVFYSTVRPSDAGNLIFEIITKSRATLHLKALNVQEFNDWLNTFSKAIQLNISIGSNITPAERAVLLAQQKRMDDEVRLASPANTVCADCNAAQPDWAAINLGILLCIECSGVHRSLGSHISKIRSLTLDLWEPEHVEIMKHIGNAKANGFWEAELPREFLKPDEKTVRRLREVWIDNKYKAKVFLPKAGIPTEALFQTMKDAACRLDLMTVEKCVAYGAEVNTKNLGDSSKTVIHYLAEGGNNVAIEFLFQNGADLTIKDAKGNLPIHYAAQRGHLDVFRLLLHRGSDVLLNEQNADGHSVSDLAVLHPALTECMEKRREKLKQQALLKQATPQLPLSNADGKEKDREPGSPKMKRAASSYSPRTSTFVPPSQTAPVVSKAEAKNPTPVDGKKPPVKPKPAHLSRRKLSDGAVNTGSLRGGSQIYAAMPSIDQDGPPPPEGMTFKTDDSALPKPPSGASPRLSLRRSPPSAPASVGGSVSPPSERRKKDEDDKKDKKKEKEKDKKEADVTISAPVNFRHVTHYESTDAPALIQQAESRKKLKDKDKIGDGPLAVSIGGPSGFRHVGSWQDQFEKDKKPPSAPAVAAVPKAESMDDVSSVSDRRDTLEKRALHPYPIMSVEVYDDAADQSSPPSRKVSSNMESPALDRSYSQYPPPPPGDSELSPRPDTEESPR